MIFGFSDSPVQIQATGEQQLDRINSNRIKVGSFLPRDPSGLGFGHRQWKTNELREFGLTIHETDCPTCSSGEEREESLNSRARSSLSPLPVVSHTVTRGLAGTDEQVRVLKGRTENEQTDCSNEERRQKVRERERRGSGGTRK
ncbi:hypothetical protein M9H77_16411 [Catharanthus roseus]|uniref:Uncharacterized protein n=1 Tax=Catharanthus roseus TaxID=4058 RepID=A0ACC0B1P3_CATRO|nr:hypothetical protein M9H77_16411 [Catharanthus roseus]